MEQSLNGRKVAILVADGFEQVEMTEPRKALDQAGAQTQLISPAQGQVQGWQHDRWGDTFPVEVSLDSADPNDYDALLLPGGVMNPDKLRMNPKAVQFAKAFFDAGKPVAAICHGPWLVVEANEARGRELTSWPSLHTDIVNAGGRWVDRQVVVDNGLVTSRKPDDIPVFNEKMIALFGEGSHRARQQEMASGGQRERQSQPV
ncbi:MAG TPA: type 1 glutamine amidotransferase domain-containing protein [Chthonomonadaceae bacterium]|nr:type 1 glutamine amidotransferase domain-containing protein [Chthonomonadaceae bacterium]